MARDEIPDDVRRFILASIPSVPYLEAMLLLRSDPDRSWSSKEIVRRLYMNEKQIDELLSDLCAAEILMATKEDAPLYRYCPQSDELKKVIDRLADTYSRNLIDVSHLIHSKTNKRAQQFADAFKWRKDS
jgi:hypothetical protein